MQRCRIIASLGVGYDRVDLDAATHQEIVVTNVPDYCIDEVSTHAVALMLALTRRLMITDRRVRSDHVTFVPPNRPAVYAGLYPARRPRDHRLGIIGFGRIGTAVALKARGLGMRVMAHDPHVYEAVMESHGVQPVDLPFLMQQSDIVSINAELNDETRGLIDARALAMMKPEAYLVNTARGEIVDEPALIEALHNGRIAGAGLDVTWSDPIPANHPLLQAPNVILTGHSGWFSTTADSGPGFWHQAARQVAAALEGRWPRYAVNPAVKERWLARWGSGSRKASPVSGDGGP
jgi:D-3-phosphoglycerate dehydrogenase